MAARLIALRRIGLSFGHQRVLDDVSMDLESGEVHILAGENGAGKSSLIKVLAGIYANYEGDVELSGRPVRFGGPHEANRAGISVIHQEMSLVGAMSVVDNIYLGRERATLRGAWLDRKTQAYMAHALCRELDLDFSAADLERPVENYALSIRNRIEIAKALAFDARVLVMDEPTSALNRVEVERLFALIGKLKRRGCGIIYISHKMEEIYRLADRITVLRDGKWVGSAAAADCPEAKLIEWMIGREFVRPTRTPAPPSRAGSDAIEVRDFCVPHAAAGRTLAVSKFSARVRPGEILGIAGLQNSGASELFNALFGAGSVECTGFIRVNGEPFLPTGPAHSVRRGLAYLTADRKATGLVPVMSVEHNITLAALQAISPGGVMSPRLERASAAEQRKRLDIRVASLEQPVSTLSGGNQQKVVLAKWILTQPNVLLLEEPTRGVDIAAKSEIYSLMSRWTAEGMAILLISSELPELLLLSDRIIVLHRGAMTGEFSRAEATPERILAAAMGSLERSPEGFQ